MNVLLVVPSLHIGGTERQAVVLANGLRAKGHTVQVATLYPGGELEGGLKDVPIVRVEKGGRWDVLGSLARLRKLIVGQDVDVTYTFLGTPNIMGAMLKPFISSKLVWGIRASEMHLSNYGWLAQVSQRIEVALSRVPDSIISNSNAGKRHAAAIGYPDNKIAVMPNGIDTEYFRPDKSKRAATRSAWGISDSHRLIGLPARVDPIKDHATFLRAASIAAAQEDSLRFVCIGGGNQAFIETLKTKAQQLGLEDRVIWAGQQRDMRTAYNALDQACLCSLGEGFPNALAEAMACGIPCSGTDVGDVAHLIGDTGMTVNVGDHVGLAHTFLEMRNRYAAETGLDKRCRKRITSNFSIGTMIEGTQALLQKMVG